jgi:hypothetical protein
MAISLNMAHMGHSANAHPLIDSSPSPGSVTDLKSPQFANAHDSIVDLRGMFEPDSSSRDNNIYFNFTFA